MDEDWWNTFGILIGTEICDDTGAGVCGGAPSTCSCFKMTGFSNITVIGIEWQTFASLVTA